MSAPPDAIVEALQEISVRLDRLDGAVRAVGLRLDGADEAIEQVRRVCVEWSEETSRLADATRDQADRLGGDLRLARQRVQEHDAEITRIRRHLNLLPAE